MTPKYLTIGLLALAAVAVVGAVVLSALGVGDAQRAWEAAGGLILYLIGVRTPPPAP